MTTATGRGLRMPTVRSSLRIAVVCHRHHLGGHQGHLYTALARRFALTRVIVEEAGWPRRLSELPEGGEFDAIVWRVRFRELRTSSTGCTITRIAPTSYATSAAGLPN